MGKPTFGLLYLTTRKTNKMKNTANVIRSVMRTKKVTQTQLAKKLGLTTTELRKEFSTMSKKENSPETKRFINKIAKAIDVPTTVFVFKSIELKDVAPERKELFKQLSPSINDIMNILIKSGPDKKRKKSSAKR
jgi:transcriptional regulator with XRE-family HTH domain